MVSLMPKKKNSDFSNLICSQTKPNFEKVKPLDFRAFSTLNNPRKDFFTFLKVLELFDDMCFFEITKRVFRPETIVFRPNYDRLSKPGPKISYRAILKKSPILTTFRSGFPVKRSISGPLKHLIEK